MENIEQTITEETATPRPSVVLRKRTKALLGVALLLGAILASGVTRSDKGQVEMGTVASADMSAPALQAKVYKQSMPMYHWHEDCPLASAKSLRPAGDHIPVKRVYMTREQAEKKHLLVCTYCADMDQK